MMLYPGEVGVCSEQMYAWMPPQQVPGTLYLTNSRLVFEAAAAPFLPQYGIGQALGLASPAPPPMLNLDLRQISNVTVIPGQSGWHVLRIEASGGAYVYQFQTPQAQNWLASIQGARGQGAIAPGGPPVAPASIPPASVAPSAASPNPAPPRGSSAAPPQMSMNAPATPSATGGTVWCMRCGKSNPAGGTKCTSCGASLG
jgi:hypothetical protein